MDTHASPGMKMIPHFLHEFRECSSRPWCSSVRNGKGSKDNTCLVTSGCLCGEPKFCSLVGLEHGNQDVNPSLLDRTNLIFEPVAAARTGNNGEPKLIVCLNPEGNHPSNRIWGLVLANCPTYQLPGHLAALHE